MKVDGEKLASTAKFGKVLIAWDDIGVFNDINNSAGFPLVTSCLQNRFSMVSFYVIGPVLLELLTCPLKVDVWVSSTTIFFSDTLGDAFLNIDRIYLDVNFV